jgi:hypothetical protein
MHTLGVDVGSVLVVNHVELVGDLALGVGDDGEGELRAGNLVNVLDPGLVGLGTVGALSGQDTRHISHNWAFNLRDRSA